MNIFIDESGSFVCANHDDAWNCVAAYFSPESDRRKRDKILTKLKLKSGKNFNDEVKLNEINEQTYFNFLESISKTNGILFCVATDCSLISEKDINEHKEEQAKRVAESKDKMFHEAGRDMVQAMHDQLIGVPPQLYLQLFCQVMLICEIVEKGILYFVQSHPRNLRKFSWRIDQKNTSKIDYEEAFEKLTPLLLQTRSLSERFFTVKEFDYTAMDKYFYTKETEPTYLEEHYGIKRSSTEGSLNTTLSSAGLLWRYCPLVGGCRPKFPEKSSLKSGSFGPSAKIALVGKPHYLGLTITNALIWPSATSHLL